MASACWSGQWTWLQSWLKEWFPYFPPSSSFSRHYWKGSNWNNKRYQDFPISRRNPPRLPTYNRKQLLSKICKWNKTWGVNKKKKPPNHYSGIKRTQLRAGWTDSAPVTDFGMHQPSALASLHPVRTFEFPVPCSCSGSFMAAWTLQKDTPLSSRRSKSTVKITSEFTAEHFSSHEAEERERVAIPL